MPNQQSKEGGYSFLTQIYQQPKSYHKRQFVVSLAIDGQIKICTNLIIKNKGKPINIQEDLNPKIDNHNNGRFIELQGEGKNTKNI